MGLCLVAVCAALLLVWPAGATDRPAKLLAGSPALHSGPKGLRWFSWYSWGSKHLAGQPNVTAKWANLAMDADLDYLLGQPLPGMLMLPRQTHPKADPLPAVFCSGPDKSAPRNSAGRTVLTPNWEQVVDGLAAAVAANQPKIVGVQLGDELVDGGLTVQVRVVANRNVSCIPSDGNVLLSQPCCCAGCCL